MVKQLTCLGLRRVLASAVATVCLSAAHASAVTLVWDTTNAAGFFGGAGTWGVDSFWSEFGVASNGTAPAAWIDGNDAAFVNGSTGGGNPNNITVSGTVSANTLRHTGGTNTTFAGGTISIGTGGIEQWANNDSFTFSTTDISLNGNQTWTLFRGVTVNSGISGAGNLIKTVGGNPGSASELKLFGTNSFSGSTKLAGGTLTLNYTTNNTSKLDPTKALIIAGGTVNVVGNTEADFIQEVGSLDVQAGHTTILNPAGSRAKLQLNGITRSTGGTVFFSEGSGSVNFTTDQPNNSAGIIGGYAVHSAASSVGWAVNSTGGDNGTITSTVGTTQNNIAAWTTGGLYNVSAPATLTAGTLTSDLTVHGLRFGMSGVGSLNIDSPVTLTLEGGGLIIQGGSTGLLIPTGTIRGSASGDLIIHQHGGGASVPSVIGAVIADNTATTAFVKAGSGSGAVILTGTNTYTGTTYINSGTLQIGSASTSGSIANSPTFSFSGGTLIFNRTDAVTVNQTITGFGTFQQSGTGTLRLTGSGSFGGFVSAAAGTMQIDNGSAGSLSLAGIGTVNVANGATLTVSSGQISASTIALGASGYINVDGGTLAIGNGVTSSTGTIALNGGAIKSYSLYNTHTGNSTNFFQSGVNVRVKSGGAVFDTNGLNTKVVATLVQDGASTGGLTKHGGNLLQLAGASNNTYVGNTTVLGGTLSLVNSSSMNPIPNSPKIILNNNAGLTVTGVAATGFELGPTQAIAGTGAVSGIFKATGATSSIVPGDTSAVGTLSFTTLSLNATSLEFDVGAEVDRVKIQAGDGFAVAGISTITLNSLGGIVPGQYPLLAFNAQVIADLTPNFALSVPTLDGFDVSLVPTTGATVGSFTAQSIDLLIQSTVTSSQWNSDVDFQPWSVSGNWIGGAPNAIDASANFGTIITSSRAVNIDSAQIAGTVHFSSPISYNLAGSSTLTMEVSAGSAQLVTTAGSHTISAPLSLNDDLLVNSAAGTGVAIANLMATGRNITKSGSGTVQFENVRAAGLSVVGCSAGISAKGSANDTSGTSNVGTLSITAGASLDLSNNGAVITKGVSTISDLRSMLNDGRLFSSSSGVGKNLGYGDNALLGMTLFSGQTVNATHALVMFTWEGDCNLDGKVNTLDFNSLAGAFGGAGVWTQGDSNYDGSINSTDFALMAGNYGKIAGSLSPALGGVVPEPSGAILVSAILGLAARRRSQEK